MLYHCRVFIERNDTGPPPPPAPSRRRRRRFNKSNKSDFLQWPIFLGLCTDVPSYLMLCTSMSCSVGAAAAAEAKNCPPKLMTHISRRHVTCMTTAYTPKDVFLKNGPTLASF